MPPSNGRVCPTSAVASRTTRARATNWAAMLTLPKVAETWSPAVSQGRGRRPASCRKPRTLRRRRRRPRRREAGRPRGPSAGSRRRKRGPRARSRNGRAGAPSTRRAPTNAPRDDEYDECGKGRGQRAATPRGRRSHSATNRRPSASGVPLTDVNWSVNRDEATSGTARNARTTNAWAGASRRCGAFSTPGRVSTPGRLPRRARLHHRGGPRVGLASIGSRGRRGTRRGRPRRGVEVDPVLGAGEAVALVGIEDVGRLAPFFSIAATICSDSACFTRGSLAPWPIRSGRTIRSARNRGEAASISGGVRRVVDVAHPDVEDGHASGSVGRDRGDERLQVRRADDVDAAGEGLRGVNEPATSAA